MIDLTPFGFTPTESRAYEALVRKGTTSAYNLANMLGIARANVYQALEGLMTRGAAVLVAEHPKAFRAIGPTALLAAVSRDQMRRLDDLESQFREIGGAGAPSTVPFSGQRELGELGLRTAVRAKAVDCLGRGELLGRLSPVWRKRVADGSATRLWCLDDAPQDLPVTPATIDHEVVRRYFPSVAILLVTPEAVLVGTDESDPGLTGYWSSDAVLLGLSRSAMVALTGG